MMPLRLSPRGHVDRDGGSHPNEHERRDRVFRLIIALGIAVLFLTKILTGTWAIVLGILAVIFFVTAVIGLCPLYAPFKFSTRKKARTS